MVFISMRVSCSDRGVLLLFETVRNYLVLSNGGSTFCLALIVWKNGEGEYQVAAWTRWRRIAPLAIAPDEKNFILLC
jgi:hypothetical protein